MFRWLAGGRVRALRLDAGLALRLSVFSLTAELVIALTTTLPNAPVIPQWPVFVLFAGVFVVHLRSVIALGKQRGHKLNFRDLLRGLPVIVRVAFVALFIVAWLVVLASILHIGGQPTEIDGRYYLNDHGSLIPATHSEYLHALVLQQRIFTLIPAVFYALGVIVNWPARSTAIVGSSGLSTDHHQAPGDTSPPTSDAANAFGLRRRRSRVVMVAVVFCLLLARLLLIGLTNQTVRGWLHIGSSLPSCAAAAISTSAGREGKCARISGLFSSRVYNVVDREHTLHMPEYQARLLTSTITHTRVTGPSTNAAYYPEGHGLLVSYEITITNTRDTTLLFGQAASDTTLPFYPTHPQVELLMPPSLASSSRGSNEDIGLGELINGRGAPTPSIGLQQLIPPHGSITGWATFVAPGWSRELLDARPADLNLYRLDHDDHYTGQIRLWK
jgi:hypothetical protein